MGDAASGLPGRGGSGGPARLHVDRSFTLRGIGTVVTGTLWSGAVGAGDSVSLLPRGLLGLHLYAPADRSEAVSELYAPVSGEVTSHLIGGR